MDLLLIQASNSINYHAYLSRLYPNIHNLGHISYLLILLLLLLRGEVLCLQMLDVHTIVGFYKT
nr:MAG TPA: hypothetical protein [Crassvirales sp.]